MSAPAVPNEPATPNGNASGHLLRRWTTFSFAVLFSLTFLPQPVQAANTAANLDQCQNGDAALGDDPCKWINGALNANKAHYAEGDSVPYRVKITGLTPGPTIHNLDIEWKIRHGSTNAFDYLTSYDRIDEAVDPCAGVPGCAMGPVSSQLAIPPPAGSPQPLSSFNALPAAEKTLAISTGGAFVDAAYLSHGSLSAANSDSSMRIRFTASSSTVVIAWGGHIADRDDWGVGNSAGGISGSPYHMRLLALDGSGGNQDMALQEALVDHLLLQLGGGLTIIKDVINDSGGSASASDFSIHVLDAANQDVPQSPHQGEALGFTYLDLPAGTYHLTETGPSGYAPSFLPGLDQGCSSNGVVTLAEGDTKTCILTNDDQASSLTVTKQFVNDNGGSADLSDVQLFIDGESVASGATTQVAPGPHTVTESGPAGYNATFSGDCAADGTVDVPLGASRSCILTDDDISPRLTVTKVVINDDGGSAGVVAFDLFVGETQVATGSTGLFDAGLYQVSESGLPGYAASFSGDCSSTGAISLAPGDVKSCTITNDDIAPKLTVTKVVANDDGGQLQVADFPLFVDGQSVASGSEQSYLAGPHSVSESGSSGYAASFTGDCDSEGSVSLSPGDVKSCTITNNDIRPLLTVLKIVTNDNGGQALVEDALLYVDGALVLSGEQNGFAAGSHQVSEAGPSGYNATIGGDCDAQGAVSLAPGDVKQCTITNDDIQPILTVTKIVINDNGGEAQVSDYILLVDGTPVTSGSATGFDAATYLVSESGPSGYSLGYSEDCDAQGSISLLVGDVKACVLTNDDIQPLLTIEKVVINDDGGQAAVGDFLLFVDETSVLSGAEHGYDAGSYVISELGPSGYSSSFSADCAEGLVVLRIGDDKTCTITNDDIRPKLTIHKTVINDDGGLAEADAWSFSVGEQAVSLDEANGFGAGSYSVSESGGPSGYELGFSGDCDAEGTVHLFIGDDKHCTLTNDDIQPLLAIHKVVVNDDGGLAEAEAWSFSVGETPVALDDILGFDAASYQVAEHDGPSGYALSFSGDCDSDGRITLAIGESYDCTLTNDDIAPILNVTKLVINDNGGAAEVADFSLFVGDAGVESGVPQSFFAGPYAISESGPSGYAASFSGDCPEALASLAIGESYACFITNDDIQPLLTVHKTVINDDGGTASASDWSFAVDETAVDLDTATGFDAGAYAVSEAGGPSGYALSFSGDCDAEGLISLAIGESYDCTLVNDDIQPLLTLHKTVINDNGGLAGSGDWSYFVGEQAVDLEVATGFDAGPYSASEAFGPAGYALSFEGDCDSEGRISLAIGESYDCTLINDDQQPRLTVLKVVVNDNGGLAIVNDTSLFVDQEPVDSGVAEGFDAGPYSVTELGPFGYAPSFSGDCDAEGNVSLAVGDEPKLCVLTNDDIQPILLVTKEVVNDDGGTAEVADFALSVGDESVTSGIAEGFDAGTYQVSESGPRGYALSFSGDCDADGNVSLAVGDVKSCTLRNDDIRPKLTIHKTVINDDGGAASAGDWNFSVGDQAVGLDEATGFMAGSYAVSESDGPSGYALGFSGDCAEDGSITLHVGDELECTLTNDDIQPLLTVHKVVINDNGGLAEAGDWSFSVGDSAVDLDAATGFDAGSYSVSESGGPAGYSLSFSGDCDETGSLDLAIGESYECTLTNDDIQPRLTVTKVVVNDNGGLAIVNDTSLFVDEEPVVSGVEEGFDAGSYSVSELGPFGYAPSFSGDCDAEGNVSLAVGDEPKLCILTNDDIQPILVLHKTVITDDGGSAQASDWSFAIDGSPADLETPIGLDAGSYAVSESDGPSGYALSFSGDCDADGDVSLAVGDVKHCTLTNDDIAPKLTLHKTVINDNGGSASAEDWDFAIDGLPADLEQAIDLPAGLHAVSEADGPSGYALTFEGDCDADGAIDMALGESYDCTLVNDDIQPKLTVRKTVINDSGGSASASDWDFSVDGQAVALDEATGFDAGSYSVSESGGPSGYALGFSGDCDATGSIDLAIGEEKTCTLTNDDRPAMLLVIKHVINDDVGYKVASDFSLHVTATDASLSDVIGNESGVLVTFDAGDFAISEGPAPSYGTSYSGCSGTLGLGELSICTVTNDDTPVASRTQGFWQTHTEFTKTVLASKLGGTMTVGAGSHVRTIDTDGKLFGAWYSDIAKQSPSGKRTDLDKARMVLLQQLVTAKLNCAAFGCSEADQALINQGDLAFAGSSAAAMKTATSALDLYNNAHDSDPIPSYLGSQGSATPKVSQSLANKPFWNNP